MRATQYIPAEDVDNRTDEVEREIIGLQQRLGELNLELGWLKAFRRRAVAIAGDEPEVEQVEASGNGQKVGAREAIIRLLGKTPNLTRKEVCARLEGAVETKSPKVRNVLYSTIHQMLSAGLLTDDFAGLLSLPKKGGKRHG